MINDLEAPIARHHPEIDQDEGGGAGRAGALGGGDVRRLGSDRVRLVSEAADAVVAVKSL